MSRENVEIVRRAFAEFERGNFWVADMFDPDVRVVWLDALEGVPESIGLEGMAEVMKSWLETWDHMTMTAERMVDAVDRVLVIARWQGRGKASGALTEWRHGQVWTLRDGKVISLDSYTDPAEALEAVGLRE